MGDFKTTLEPKIQDAVNLISLVSAIVSVFLVLFLAFFRYQFINRVTLRFQVWIAILDTVKHLTYLGFEQPEGPMCTLIAFFVYFGDHLYIFLNVMIALNVQLLYIHNIQPKKRFELFYLLGAIGSALLIDTLPLAFDVYGKNTQNYCTYRETSENRKIYKFFLVYFTTIPGVMYCLICFLVVCILLKNNSEYFRKRWPDKVITLYGEQLNVQDFIQKLNFRMSLYPVSCFVGLFPYILANLLFDTLGYYGIWLYFLARLGRRLVGTMNLISLLYDPHFQLAALSLWRNYVIQFKFRNSISSYESAKVNLPSYSSSCAGNVHSESDESGKPFENYISYM